MSNLGNTIEIRNGKPQMIIDGRAHAPMAFATLGPTTSLEDAYLRRLGQAGIEVFFIHCNLPWLDDLELDFASLVHNLTRLRREVAGAKVFLRLNLHPPKRWLEENPDELFHCENGELYRCDYTSCFYSWKDMEVYSLLSSKWRLDAGRQLEKLLDKINELPDGQAVVGHFLSAGGTSEWIQRGGIADYGPASRRHFSDWLKRKYETIENLCRAWNASYADFCEVGIPSTERLAALGYRDLENLERSGEAVETELVVGAFAKPEEIRDVLDFHEATHNGVVESIEYFARIIKAHSGGRLLCGAFHGTLNNTGLHRTLLGSEAIDFLANPGVYVNRRPGEVTDIHCLSDSFLLHDKIYMVEDDVRTHCSPPVVREHYFINSVADALTQMKRDFGRDLCRNLYGWWFDMYDPDALSKIAMVDAAKNIPSPPSERGSWWYDAPETLDLIKKIQRIARESLGSDCRRNSEIAVIMDERSVLLSLVAHKKMLNWRMSILSRLGAPVDFFYCDDLDNPRLPDYKFYIFPNAWTLDSAQRHAIAAKVRRNGAVVLWLYASGVHHPDDADSFGVDNMEALTGLRFDYAPEVVETAFCLNDTMHPATAGCSSRQTHGRLNFDIYRNIGRSEVPAGSHNYQSPNFHVADAHADVLGNFQHSGLPALACRDFGDWRSLHCATQYMEPELLRAIARYAGCHIVCDSDDFIFMNSGYLNVHASSTGEKCLNLPRHCSPVEMYSGEGFGENVDRISIRMERGETRTFRL